MAAPEKHGTNMTPLREQRGITAPDGGLVP